MKTWLTTVLSLLIVASTATLSLAQGVLLYNNPVTGGGGTGYLSLNNKYASVLVEVTIATTATVEFYISGEGTQPSAVACIDVSGTDGTLSTSTIATGTYICPANGATSFQATVSAHTGGVRVFSSPSAGSVRRGGSGGAGTLDQAFNGGKVITGANSLANAFRVGDGTTPMCQYTDATLGPVIRPCTDSNTRTFIWTNFTWCLYDIEGDACILTVDPDAASKNAMYQFGAAYYPEKVARVALSPRGAVTIAEESIVTNQPESWYATITDANTDAVDFAITVTADMSHVTTATVKLYGVSKNAAPSGNIELDCAIKSFRPGTDTFAAHSTTGEQAVLLTPATQNRPVATTSSAITINGTVATGAILYGSCEVDATATTSAQLTDFRLLGYADVRFTSNSLSN